MECREALSLTIHTFGLIAEELATAAKIDPSRLSRYRNGQNEMGAEALNRVIAAMPIRAKAYYYMLLMGNVMVNQKLEMEV